MASEHGDPGTLPSEIEEWVADQTEETGESRETVLARAVASYRLLTEDEDVDSALETTLAELEARLDRLESEDDPERIDRLESELDEHVEDLRSRILKVIKIARGRAPTDHSHEELASRLDEQAATVDQLDQSTAELAAEVSDLETTMRKHQQGVEQKLGSTVKSVETVESKADRLAEAVVKLQRRIGRIESHVTHQTALAELLETAARKDVEKARCDNCNEIVKLPLLVEPACPHCRSVFDSVEPGSMFFKSAWLTVADRPALEAGSTTETPFDGGDTRSQASNSGSTRQDKR